MSADAEIKLTPEQQAAVDEVVAWVRAPIGKKMLSLTGAAGTGKTTTLNEIRKALPGATCWSAMTGKAALRLSNLAAVSARTLHASIYKPPIANGRHLNFSMMRKPDCQVLVIDESSMITPKIYNDLQEWVGRGVKVLFVGDGYQLPPIMTPKEEKEFGDDFIIFREIKGPSLKTVMRSGDGIIEIATGVRDTRQFPSKGNDSVRIDKVRYPGLAAIKDFLEDQNDHILITWTNRMRMQGNAEIRRKLGHNEMLPGPKEPVLICKNGQDRLNGEIVYANGFSPGPTLADVKTMWMHVNDGTDVLVSVAGKDQPMDGFMPNVKDWKEYHVHRNKQNLDEPLPITYGYVSTAHKAQGSEFKRVSIYLSDSDVYSQHFNKGTRLPDGEEMPFAIRWLYTSLTRAKAQATIYTGL
jgi:hypothetical protein